MILVGMLKYVETTVNGTFVPSIYFSQFRHCIWLILIHFGSAALGPVVSCFVKAKRAEMTGLSSCSKDYAARKQPAMCCLHGHGPTDQEHTHLRTLEYNDMSTNYPERICIYIYIYMSLEWNANILLQDLGFEWH